MATSDSEDFESADEDLDIQTGHTSSHTNKKVHGKHPVNDGGDNKKTSIRDDELKSDETGSGDLGKTSGFKNCDVKEASGLSGNKKANIGTGNESITEDRIKDRPHSERSRRQQKPREPKSSGSLRKLGTKITTNNAACNSERSVSHKEHLDTLTSEKADLDRNLTDNDKNEINEEKINSQSVTENLDKTIEDLSIGKKEENDIAPALDRLSQSASEKPAETGSNWSGWGGWGVTSLLSTATESVTTFSTQVSQGLSTVLDTGLGAPTPEELARLGKEEELKLLEEKEQNKVNELSELQRVEEQKSEAESSGLFGLGNILSGVTKLVETTGNKVLTGGLDTLETIGKKTMEVLQEGDPGLKKKRALFSEKIVLSQVLREAKDKAERETQEIEDKEAARKAHFETLFDDYQGLVHLEALEMLSKQCDIKLQSVLLSSPGPTLTKMQDSIKIVKDLCQLPDDEEIEDETKIENWVETINTVTKDLGAPFSIDKLNKTWDEAEQWLEECRSNQTSPDGDKVINPRDIHQKAIATLAQLTAAAVEQFHKVAELLLVRDGRTPTQEAEILLQVTTVLTTQLSTMATRFSECLNTASEGTADSDAVNALITNVFLEAANSSSYIQEAFQLLVPVLQVGVTI